MSESDVNPGERIGSAHLKAGSKAAFSKAGDEWKDKYEISDDLRSLFFPKWASRDTLEAQVYRSLYAEIETEVQPQNIFEEMEAIEITNCFWEQQQIQNSMNDIVKSARCNALATILAPMLGNDYDSAVALAGRYFSDGLEKRKSVEDLLRSHGLGPESIDGLAIAQRAFLLPVLNRTTAALGVRRDQIVAEVMRRRDERGRRRNKKKTH